MPGLVSNISGSCVMGVYVFFRGKFYKDSNQKGEKTMKTKMKKLISIGTIALFALALLLDLGTVLADDDEKPAPSLACTIECHFAGHLGIFDDDGRLLVWTGEIDEDIEGVILWWFDLTGSKDTGLVKHYVARWEIWSDDPLEENSEAVLLLAGDDAGTTSVPPGKDGIWQGEGMVTEAYGEFEDWNGRHVHETGNVTWAIPGVLPLGGEGIFRIN